MKRLTSLLILGLLFGSLSSPLAHAQNGLQDKTTYDEALAQYEAYKKLSSFFLESMTWNRLARTRDPRAVPVLIDAHKTARVNTQARRHTISAIATRYMLSGEGTPGTSLDEMASWRADFEDEADTWLWYRTLAVDALNRGPDACMAILSEKKASLEHRAAALEALGWCKDPEPLYKAIASTILNLPKKPYEKAILIGAMGTALERHKSKVTTGPFKVGCLRFVHLLDEEYGLETSTKLVIARSLARITDTGELFINAEPWIAKIGQKKAKSSVTEEVGYVKPTFFGVEASGSRICYVIDMSDSMCKAVEVPEDERNGPRSGPDAEEGPQIPWHLVETRFDLAREQLKLSLKQLDSDVMFAVVYFGDRAGLFKSSKGMTKASKGAIKQVIKELDAIKTKGPTNTRPDGRLRGKTNLHGALRTAFRVKKKGIVKEHSYIDLDTFENGADTIFLLSDGDPSWDDYQHPAKNVGEVPIGDPESGVSTPGGKGGTLDSSGPYRFREVLVEDIERLNLFREVEIHCISIGKEVSGALLKQIADLGHGTVLNMGG